MIAAVAVFVAAPSLASGSIIVTESARKASLRVAANGDAEIRWKLPFKPVLRKAPNGFFYALQT